MMLYQITGCTSTWNSNTGILGFQVLIVTVHHNFFSYTLQCQYLDWRCSVCEALHMLPYNWQTVLHQTLQYEGSFAEQMCMSADFISYYKITLHTLSSSAIQVSKSRWTLFEQVYSLIHFRLNDQISIRTQYLARGEKKQLFQTLLYPSHIICTTFNAVNHTTEDYNITCAIGHHHFFCELSLLSRR